MNLRAIRKPLCDWLKERVKPVAWIAFTWTGAVQATLGSFWIPFAEAKREFNAAFLIPVRDEAALPYAYFNYAKVLWELGDTAPEFRAISRNLRPLQANRTQIQDLNLGMIGSYLGPLVRLTVLVSRVG